MTWLSLDISLQAKETTISLILTKLNRPRLPVDLVPRPHLTAWLEQRLSRPLTLVSAPAGYGNSTLISGGWNLWIVRPPGSLWMNMITS
jgi:LuxR family maltose regulon positive regulatory protein